MYRSLVPGILAKTHQFSRKIYPSTMQRLTITANCIEAVEEKTQGHLFQGTECELVFYKHSFPKWGNVQQTCNTAVE